VNLEPVYVDGPCSQEIVSWTPGTDAFVWAWRLYTSEAGVSVALRVRVVVATTHGLADGALDWEPFVVKGADVAWEPPAEERSIAPAMMTTTSPITPRPTNTGFELRPAGVGA
jgi:hypothetical protein